MQTLMTNLRGELAGRAKLVRGTLGALPHAGGLRHPASRPAQGGASMDTGLPTRLYCTGFRTTLWSVNRQINNRLMCPK